MQVTVAVGRWVDEIAAVYIVLVYSDEEEDSEMKQRRDRGCEGDGSSECRMIPVTIRFIG